MIARIVFVPDRIAAARATAGERNWGIRSRRRDARKRAVIP